MTNNQEYNPFLPQLEKYIELCNKTTAIAPELYNKYEVKRGLRDISGRGVLAGLTEISEVRSYITVDSEMIPCEGKLFYRGIDVEDIVNGFLTENRFGFEEVVYLLLFGEMPSSEAIIDFSSLLKQYRTLPPSFVRDIIMKAPGKDMMNILARCVLTLYVYDEKADDISLPNVLRQCLQLISQFPLLSVYGYQAFTYYHGSNSLVIHPPKDDLSTAENILHMLRPDSKYTPLEAKILDLALVLHAEHGGGNNSSFTTHVVSSSGTDTYATIASSLGSLKGPRHGGANVKVIEMIENIKENVSDWNDEDEIRNYLRKILNKEAFDKSGLIYGMGHAVYSISDPRSNILKGFVELLSSEKGLTKEFEFYSLIEKLAPKVISEERKIYKGVSANIDFFSGFVYHMLNLPKELFTPVFAIARIAGWSAHRIEELLNAGKIIRPAYKSIAKHTEYIPMKDR